MENLRLIDPDKMKGRMIDYLKHETKLYYCGFSNLARHYNFMLGNCTDITGYPASGKTLFLIDILYNLSEEYGLKHILHLPDAGKPEEVIALLVNKFTGMTYSKSKHNSFESENGDHEDDVIKAMTWINRHFSILDYDTRPTPIEFWEFVGKTDYHTGCIDSWNYMKKTSSGTDYLAEALSERNIIAEKYNKHFITVIHPRSPDGKKDFDKSGKLKAPDVHNIMGGSEWNNNAKNVIVVHKEDSDDNRYDIYIRKAKPRVVGKTGFLDLRYDEAKQRFYSDAEFQEFYAYNKKRD